MAIPLSSKYKSCQQYSLPKNTTNSIGNYQYKLAYINLAYLAAYILKSFNIIADYILACSQQSGIRAIKGNINLGISKRLQQL